MTSPVRATKGKVRELVRAAQAAGWRVELTGGGHVKFLPPGGRPVFGSQTPSDPSAWRNMRSDLRRAGLEV